MTTPRIIPKRAEVSEELEILAWSVGDASGEGVLVTPEIVGVTVVMKVVMKVVNTVVADTLSVVLTAEVNVGLGSSVVVGTEGWIEMGDISGGNGVKDGR